MLEPGADQKVSCNRHCERSEAIQASLPPSPKGGSHGLDCFVTLAMTTKGAFWSAPTLNSHYLQIYMNFLKFTRRYIKFI
jgi:hypothetical protein